MRSIFPWWTVVSFYAASKSRTWRMTSASSRIHHAAASTSVTSAPPRSRLPPPHVCHRSCCPRSKSSPYKAYGASVISRRSVGAAAVERWMQRRESSVSTCIRRLGLYIPSMPTISQTTLKSLRVRSRIWALISERNQAQV
jgi:hypothetical protein